MHIQKNICIKSVSQTNERQTFQLKEDIQSLTCGFVPKSEATSN
jgi:hypothetical protein